VCYPSDTHHNADTGDFGMASTLQPVSIPLSLAVIVGIWAAERFNVSEILQVESGTTNIKTHEPSKYDDSQILRIDVGKSLSMLKSRKSSPLNRPKVD